MHRLDLNLVTFHGHHTGMNLLQLGMSDIIERTVLIFLCLSVIPVLYRTIISRNTAVDISLLPCIRTGKAHADIAMLLTYRICGRNGVIRQTIVSLRSYVQEKLLLSNPEASRQGMRGKQFLMYTMSADHPGYPVRQKYLQYSQQADESCLYNTVCRPLFLLSECPDNAFCHALQDG